VEWERLGSALERVVSLGVDVSVDTWNPEVMRRSISAGATIMNAADGMQGVEMMNVAAATGVRVVVPFILGEDPKAMSLTQGDPWETMIPWFRQRIEALEAAGIRRECLILDPGTGFGPADWQWEERRKYQEAIYSRLDELRVFELPIYVALPWKFDGGRLELLDMALTAGIDFGRVHHPRFVRERCDILGLSV
jgi:dihydropteroate synthase